MVGISTRRHKNLKDLKKENLRDNMTDLKLALNMLAEATTTGISKVQKPDTFDKSKAVAQSKGNAVNIDMDGRYVNHLPKLIAQSILPLGD